MYIITQTCGLEKQKDYEIFIEPPEGIKRYLMSAANTRHQCYQIECYGRRHEIICPRYTFEDGGFLIVIPWYLIPGRPYPVEVYLYACGIYCENPEMGQRGAAEATRKEFGLETFSHSTVGRSFRAFEQSRKEALENAYGGEAQIGSEGTPMIIGAAAKGGASKEKAEAQPPGRFPTASDTAARRGEMADFFPRFHPGEKTSGMGAICLQFVENWHKKARRLIL